MKISLKKIFRCGFVIYLIAVLYLCFGHFDNTPDIPWTLLGIPSDKLVHFCMFFPFPILAFLAFDKYTETPKSTFLFSGITWVLGLLLAFGTEWGQAHLTDYRSGDPWDLLADALALTLSTVLVIIWDLSKQKK
jgi:VanZ family protein